MKTILLPLDGSNVSLEALPHALGMARRYHAELLLLAVDEEPGIWQVDGQPYDDWGARKQALDGLCARIQGAGWSARVLTVPGIAPDQILRVAHEEKAAMIVLSSHGRSGLGRWLMGSTADQVTRHAECSVLVVRSTGPLTEELNEGSLTTSLAGAWPVYRRILVPLDGAVRSEHALSSAAMICPADGTLTLLRVLNFPAPLYGRPLPPGWVATESRHLETQHREYLKSQAARVYEWAPGVEVELSTRRGSPAAEILEAAEHADLVVMTRCSRTWLEKLVVGSVVSRVMHHVTCPLLLVRVPD